MDKLTPYNTGHFSVPNEVANAADVPLTHEEFRIYIMICRFASNYKKVFPSYAKIREHCAIGSDSTVRKALNGLVEKGLLHIKPQKRKGTNAKSSNLYTLLKPQVNRKNTDENECPVCGGSTANHEHKKPPETPANTGVDGIGSTPAVEGFYTGCRRVLQQAKKGSTPGVEEIKRLNKYNKSVSQSVLDNDGQDKTEPAAPKIEKIQEPPPDEVTEEEIDQAENEIKARIGYEELRETRETDMPLVDEFVNSLLDVEFTENAIIRIKQEDKPLTLVKRQLRKLNYDAIVRCLDQFEKQREKIKNKPVYIRTMLYCATLETEAHYANLYNSRGSKP